MTEPFQPADQAQRSRILNDLDSTLFVEAGAGTGKTSSLVGRIVRLVATGRAEVGRVAAITFTDKAAAELRDRVREEMEKAARDEQLPTDERTRIETALPRDRRCGHRDATQLRPANPDRASSRGRAAAGRRRAGRGRLFNSFRGALARLRRWPPREGLPGGRPPAGPPPRAGPQPPARTGDRPSQELGPRRRC